jgi:hypothetical protein
MTDILWADSQFVKLSLDYDTASIRIRAPNGKMRVVTARGYLGIEWVGVWDETVITSARVEDDHDLQRRALARLAEAYQRLPESGSPARNRGGWKTLVITFSDNSELRCTAATFEED